MRGTPDPARVARAAAPPAAQPGPDRVLALLRQPAQPIRAEQTVAASMSLRAIFMSLAAHRDRGTPLERIRGELDLAGELFAEIARAMGKAEGGEAHLRALASAWAIGCGMPREHLARMAVTGQRYGRRTAIEVSPR